MRRSFFLALLFLYPFFAFADNISLVIWTTTGERISHLLNEKPVIIDKADQFIINTIKSQVEYPKNLIHKFTLEPEAEASITLNCKSPEILMDFRSNTILLQNCEKEADVNIYTLSGILLVHSAKTDENGDVSISMSNYSKGVYIISTSVITYKIMIK